MRLHFKSGKKRVPRIKSFKTYSSKGSAADFFLVMILLMIIAFLVLVLLKKSNESSCNASALWEQEEAAICLLKEYYDPKAYEFTVSYKILNEENVSIEKIVHEELKIDGQYVDAVMIKYSKRTMFDYDCVDVFAFLPDVGTTNVFHVESESLYSASYADIVHFDSNNYLVIADVCGRGQFLSMNCYKWDSEQNIYTSLLEVFGEGNNRVYISDYALSYTESDLLVEIFEVDDRLVALPIVDRTVSFASERGTGHVLNLCYETWDEKPIEFKEIPLVKGRHRAESSVITVDTNDWIIVNNNLMHKWWINGGFSIRFGRHTYLIPSEIGTAELFYDTTTVYGSEKRVYRFEIK